MESNKDEALKCLAISKKSLDSGDFAKATRFAEKSIRLFPMEQGEQLLSQIKTKSSERPAASNHPKSSTKPAFTRTTTPSEPAQDRKYTAEQVKAVKTILACGRDYYKVLKVERTATDIQIKKGYRKQALQFHPDKNSAPGADEAFKLIAKAFDILSDPNKKAVHDEGGDADSSRGRSSASSYHQQQYAHNRRYGDDVSPEDLFNMFFGGGMRTGGFQQQQQHQYQQQRQQRFSNAQNQRRQQSTNSDDFTASISQMMPIIFIAILAIFAILFSFENEPLYTFHPSAGNTQLRSTKLNNVNYYVNPHVFDTNVKNNMYKFKTTERQVEEEWVGELRRKCQQEQRHRQNLMAQSDGFIFGVVGRNEKAYKAAENMKLKNCDELRKLSKKLRG